MIPSYDRIVIGAGPAGLMAAAASQTPCLVLESQTQAGKKLLVSGSGQCNFSHALDPEAFLERCGSFGRFLKPALHALSPESLIRYLRNLGCPSIARPDGKVFPATLKAVDVRDALLRGALKPGNAILYGTKIARVDLDHGFRLSDGHGKTYACKSLVIACGGASWPQTGSDGSGYDLARQLGHNVLAPRPALASITVCANPFGSCAGISLKTVDAGLCSNHGLKRVSGDLLFTHNGLSGPLILDNSHLLGAGNTISLCLVPDSEARLQRLLTSKAKSSLKNALKLTGLPEALLQILLQMAGLDPQQRCADLSKPQFLALKRVLSALELRVAQVESLTTAMLTAGGVDLNELKAKDLSSKLVPGLYFAGEILDYNLPTGGFNIQAACSTGWLAGLAKPS